LAKYQKLLNLFIHVLKEWLNGRRKEQNLKLFNLEAIEEWLA